MSSGAEVASIIGTLAAVSSTASFAPQAWKIIKTRATKDLSKAMYSLTVAGFALWSVYGLVLGQWPLILSNGLCLVLSLFILLMKLLPKQTKDRVADQLDPST